MRDNGVKRGGGTGQTALAGRQGRREPSAYVTGLAPASTLVRTQSQEGGGGGEGGTKTTPPGAPPITAESQDANMTTMTIVMVNFL